MSAVFASDFFILPAPEYKLQVLSCLNAAAEAPEIIQCSSSVSMNDTQVEEHKQAKVNQRGDNYTTTTRSCNRRDEDKECTCERTVESPAFFTFYLHLKTLLIFHESSNKMIVNMMKLIGHNKFHTVPGWC